MRQIRLPTPPNEYDAVYMRALVRDIDIMFSSMTARGAGSFTTVNISQLPTSAAGLNPGDLWNDAGTVKVVT